MQIFIPTYGRAKEQVTLSHLLLADCKVTLVVQEREALLYSSRWHSQHMDIVVLPDHIRTISTTRDYIIANCKDESILMLDDDLDFATRREDDPSKFRPSNPDDISRMLEEVRFMLEEHLYPFVSIGAREGGNRNTEPVLYNTRAMRALGYRTDFLEENKITFAPMELMEDFHVALQILLAGGTLAIANRWVTNQRRGSNAPGGCSSYRTLEKHGEAAVKLAERYPKYVTVVEKQTKTAWNGEPRLDVRVAWKRAAEDGRKNARRA